MVIIISCLRAFVVSVLKGNSYAFELMKRKRLEEILKRFKKQEILVIGDLILDRFIQGKVNRISPEAPVPIVKMSNENFSPGGAGNVAVNITSLGAKCKLVGIIGGGQEGKLLKVLLRKRKVKGLFLSNCAQPTITKTRILAQGQQLLRLDQEKEISLSQQFEKRIEKYLAREAKFVSAFLISDYGKGIFTPSLLKKVIAIARENKKTIAVDPYPEHFFLYRGVSLLTPNRQEAAAGMKKREPETEREIVHLGKEIRRRLNCKSLFITEGSLGMTIFEKKKIIHLPTQAREVFDVTGAGDTVIGVATLVLSAGGTTLEAATIASFAAGVVVGKVGTATVSPKEIVDSFTSA